MGDETLGESATADCSYEPPSKIGKHPSESEVGIEYPFSTDEFLKVTTVTVFIPVHKERGALC